MTERIKVTAGKGEHHVTNGSAQFIDAYYGGSVVHRGSTRRISAFHCGEVWVEGNVGRVHARGGNVSVHGDVKTAVAEDGGVIYVYGKVDRAKVEGIACVRATGKIDQKTIKGPEGPYTVLTEMSHIDKTAEKGFEERLGVHTA